MILYLVRHAEAVELGTPGAASDFDRFLTPNGNAQTLAMAQAFARLKLPVDAVVSSPFVRAYQTATGLLSVWQPDVRPITHDTLAPEKLKPNKLSEFLGEVPGEFVVAVGHMPDLGTYAEWLLGTSAGAVPFAKAAVACIEFRADPAKASGRLRWFVSPEWVM
ncbi:histidine phosphatase family protein [Gemmata sp. JC673]|uniref:Histidine phosphatase family protein n=1 Tax=Gemmata algarum TaxID=2975278 RepID=A0ABU5EXM7_9BACT|nr:histidine phosphatase family protein [Gemmata algarum]MDY3560062.1 histidine phosphatase family protein [Gemmata algarum]